MSCYKCLYYCSGKSRLELRCRSDGESLITDMRVAPVIPGTPGTETMFAQGYACGFVCLMISGSSQSSVCACAQRTGPQAT